MESFAALGNVIGKLHKDLNQAPAVAESSVGCLTNAALAAVPGASAYYLSGRVD